MFNFTGMPDEPYHESSPVQRFTSAARQHWQVWLVAGMVFANGFFEIVQPLVLRQPEPHDILSYLLVPFGIYHLSRVLTLVSGLLLMYLSFNLVQRKRAAWLITLGISVLLTGIHLLHRSSLFLAIAPGSMVLLLVLFRERFTVRSEISSIRQGVALAILCLLAALVYGTLGFWLLHKRDFGIQFSIAQSVLRTLREFALIGNGDLVTHTNYARFFLASLDGLGIIAGILAAYSLFRPLTYQFVIRPQEREKARRILERHSRSPDDYFKLWPEKSYFFSASGKSFVAFKVEFGVAISVGDPSGPLQEMEGITRSFMRFCNDNGWVVVFMQTNPETLPVYKKLGLRIFRIGEEAIINIAQFSSRTVRAKRFRYIFRRFGVEGYKVSKHDPPHPQKLLNELYEVSNDWLTLSGKKEHGFALGYFDRGYINETVIYTLDHPSEAIVAFVNMVPSFTKKEATVDLMRHRTTMQPGAMDYLFAQLLLKLKSEGWKTFNLGVAPLQGLGPRSDAKFEERLAKQLASFFGYGFSYGGLSEYKKKFEPNLVGSYLAYSGGAANLIKIGVAISRVLKV